MHVHACRLTDSTLPVSMESYPNLVVCLVAGVHVLAFSFFTSEYHLIFHMHL